MHAVPGLKTWQNLCRVLVSVPSKHFGFSQLWPLWPAYRQNRAGLYMPHTDFKTLSLPRNLCCWCKPFTNESHRQVKPTGDAHFLEVCFSWTTHEQSDCDTGHPVTSLQHMANTSPWTSWDAMRAGKGLNKIFETLHSDSPSRLSPVQTSFCGLDLFSRSWGRLKETWSLEDCIHQNFTFKTTRNK